MKHRNYSDTLLNPLSNFIDRAERLIEVTYEAMMRGIAAIRPFCDGRHSERTPI